MSEQPRTTEEAEEAYTKASKELGRLIADDAGEAAIEEARARRNAAQDRLDELRLAAQAERERVEEQAQQQAEADKQAAKAEAQQIVGEIEQLADDAATAIGDAGVAARKLYERAGALADTARRAGLNAKALDILKLQEALRGRLFDEAHTANIAFLPHNASPQSNLAAWVGQLKMFVGSESETDSKEAA